MNTFVSTAWLLLAFVVSTAAWAHETGSHAKPAATAQRLPLGDGKVSAVAKVGS